MSENGSKNEKQPETERRGMLRTLFDPKTFPTLIPVIVAIGSAFITLDRMIQQVNTRQIAIVEQVEENENMINQDMQRVAELSARLSALETLVNSGTKDRYFGSQASRDFEIRDQRLAFMQEQLDKLKGELEEVADEHDQNLNNLERWKERILQNKEDIKELSSKK